MKVLHVVNKCTHTSIPVEWAIKMAEQHEVVVASFYDSEKKVSIFQKKIDQYSIIGCGFSFLHPFKGIKKLYREISQGNYDVIHTHHVLSGAIARILAYKKYGKVVHTVHAEHSSFALWQNILIGLTLKKTDAIVFNSKNTQNSLYSWQKRCIRNRKQVIIYNGIDIEQIISADTTWMEKFCVDNNIGQNTLLFAQIGRLEKVKNPLGSLKGFEHYLEMQDKLSKDIRFVYIGDGAEREEMECYIAQKQALHNSVIMTGTIQRSHVYAMLHRIDILVVPSIHEGFCNALFEGLTLGKQLAVSDIAVFKELIFEEENVIRFDPQKVDSIAKTLKQCEEIILQNRKLGKIIVKPEMRYTLNACILKYEALYNSLLS